MNFEKSFLSSKNLDNKAVLLRVDYNVPLEGETLLDDERLVRSIPTIEHILSKTNNLKILSHLGRPEEGEAIASEFSLAPIAKRLSELLDKEVTLVKSLEELKESKNLCMLENIRSFEGEKNNEDELSVALSQLGDIFIMDAFGTCLLYTSDAADE